MAIADIAKVGGHIFPPRGRQERKKACVAPCPCPGCQQRRPVGPDAPHIARHSNIRPPVAVYRFGVSCVDVCNTAPSGSTYYHIEAPGEKVALVARMNTGRHRSSHPRFVSFARGRQTTTARLGVFSSVTSLPSSQSLSYRILRSAADSTLQRWAT